MSLMNNSSKFIFSNNKNKLKPSQFSLAVCLSIVFSSSVSFLAGFFLSSFTLKENYSSVYESLLSEIDEARSCLTRQKSNLQRLTLLHAKALKGLDNTQNNQTNNQAILSVFNFDKNKACNEIKNMLTKNVQDFDITKDTLLFLKENCN